jgi:hypothetical protein
MTVIFYQYEADRSFHDIYLIIFLVWFHSIGIGTVPKGLEDVSKYPNLVSSSFTTSNCPRHASGSHNYHVSYSLISFMFVQITLNCIIYITFALQYSSRSCTGVDGLKESSQA